MNCWCHSMIGSYDCLLLDVSHIFADLEHVMRFDEIFFLGAQNCWDTTNWDTIGCLVRFIRWVGETWPSPSGLRQYNELVRCSVATAGNDHRLGAQEAPPAIISLYPGQGAAPDSGCLDDTTNIYQNIIYRKNA